VFDSLSIDPALKQDGLAASSRRRPVSGSAGFRGSAQGKIERWHQTLKNRILLENYYLPGDLEAHIGRFVDHYNHPPLSTHHYRACLELAHSLALP
jgi:hypothetical protein